MSPEFVEKCALKRLSEKIAQHFLGWAVLNVDFILFYTVSDEVVSDIKVPSAFATRGGAILFKEDGALIILE